MPNQRRDTIWQQPDMAKNYFASRPGIPLEDVQLDVVRRVLEEFDVDVRTLLDLGAGDGAAAAAVHSWKPVDHMVLVDFSHPMLDEARLRFAGVAAEIDYIEGDLFFEEWLPAVTERGPFDAVVSRYAIHHLPDERKQSLYNTIFELLRPGGVFVNNEHVKSATPAYKSAMDKMLIEGIYASSPDSLTFQEAAATFREVDDNDADILASTEEQCQWLREIGFVDVDCAFKIFELAVFVGKKPSASVQ